MPVFERAAFPTPETIVTCTSIDISWTFSAATSPFACSMGIKADARMGGASASQAAKTKIPKHAATTVAPTEALGLRCAVRRRPTPVSKAHARQLVLHRGGGAGPARRNSIRPLSAPSEHLLGHVGIRSCAVAPLRHTSAPDRTNRSGSRAHGLARTMCLVPGKVKAPSQTFLCDAPSSAGLHDVRLDRSAAAVCFPGNLPERQNRIDSSAW